MPKFLKFILFTASVLCGIHCIGFTYITPLERTVSFTLACLFFFLFLCLSFLKKLWTKPWAAAAALLLTFLIALPAATFRSLTLTEIFGVEALSSIKSIEVEPLSISPNSPLPIYRIIWTPDGTSGLTVSQDPNSTEVFISGGSAEFPEEYAANVTVQNFWTGKSRELPFYSVEILFTDSYEITFYWSDDAWRVVWNSKWTDANWLPNFWYPSIPITEIFDPQVLEAIHAMIGAS